MKQKAEIVDLEYVIRKTRNATERTTTLQHRLREFDSDGFKAARLSQVMCKSCYYLCSHIGGCAMTIKPCGICGNEVTYSSTNTGVLCKECATKHHLCAYCGGDLDMKQRRKL